MVVKLNQWFVFEPGDKVMVLPEGREGFVTESITVDSGAKTQTIRVQLRNSEEVLDTGRIDLVKRRDTSF